MATQELNVKFKVDASDVTSGSKEAKDKVKDAASQMAQDVKSSSQKMEQSFKDVAKSTDSIKDATKTATTAVKTMEAQVDSSAKNMEKSMDSVSKKMSAMQAFHMGARGVQMIGGLAENIASAYGADETAAGIKTATGIASSATQGAATGFMVAGPIGAAAGGLLGAANSLLTAGKELQNAAKAQDEKAKSDLETRRREIVHQNDVNKWTKEANTLATNAYGNGIVFGTDEGKSALNANIEAQRNRIANLTAQRDKIAMNYDENGDVFAQAEKMRALDDSIAYATEKLNIFLQAAQNAADVEQKAIAATEAGIKAAEEAIEARKQEAIAIRKRQEEADAKTAAATEKQRNSITAMFEQFDRQIQKTSAKKDPVSLDSAFESLKTVVDNIRNLRTAFNNGESVDPEVLKKNFTDFNFYKDIIDSAAKEGESTLADLQSQLNGQMRANAAGPSDALTKMGGGIGYTSYNNSVEGVQKTISDDLKKLIQNQTTYNSDISTKLQQLLDKPLGGSATWGGTEGE